MIASQKRKIGAKCREDKHRKLVAHTLQQQRKAFIVLYLELLVKFVDNLSVFGIICPVLGFGIKSIGSNDRLVID